MRNCLVIGALAALMLICGPQSGLSAEPDAWFGVRAESMQLAQSGPRDRITTVPRGPVPQAGAGAQYYRDIIRTLTIDRRTMARGNPAALAALTQRTERLLASIDPAAISLSMQSTIAARALSSDLFLQRVVSFTLAQGSAEAALDRLGRSDMDVMAFVAGLDLEGALVGTAERARATVPGGVAVLADGSAQAGDGVASSFFTGIGTAGEGVRTTLSGIVRTVKETVGDVAECADLPGRTKDGVGHVRAGVSAAVVSVLMMVKELASRGLEFGKTSVGKAVQLVKEVISRARDVADALLTRAKTAVADGASFGAQAIKTVQRLQGRIADAVRGIGEKGDEVGQAILESAAAAEGRTAACFATIAEAVQSLCGGIVNPFERAACVLSVSSGALGCLK